MLKDRQNVFPVKKPVWIQSPRRAFFFISHLKGSSYCSMNEWGCICFLGQGLLTYNVCVQCIEQWGPNPVWTFHNTNKLLVAVVVVE